MKNPMMTTLLAGGLVACASQPTPPTESATMPSTRDASSTVAVEAATANPLLGLSTLPYHYPPFDRFRNEHFMPAFEIGMAEGRAEIERIAANPAAPTFDNTIVAMERSGQTLGRVSAVFFNLTSAHTNDELDRIDADVSPKLSAYNDAIVLDARLFGRVRALYEQRATLGLDAESQRLLERYYVNFIRAGAQLSDADKDKLKAYNEQLAKLTTQFQQNVLKETNDSAVVVDTRAELDGLDDSAIAAAAAAAKAKGLDGKFVLKLQNTSGQPALAVLKNRALRERLYKASIERGNRGNDADNKAVVAAIVQVRADRAHLLGYPSHAAYQLEDTTAKTTAAVNKLLGQLAAPAVGNARREAADMQKIIDAQRGGFKLAAWDWAYYAEAVRKQRYDLDESEIKPYFELRSVLENGVFYAAHELYGLSFSERTDLPKYHPDIRTFEVFHDGKALGIFIFDPFKRDSKRGGAWMNSYVDQSALFGYKPVVANHLNITKPADGQPVLLTSDEVQTTFHEFGHALHGLFSNVRYPLFSGTSVPRDFVEYPSQANEMWATWPKVLANYAKHYQTGEPMPLALVAKIQAAEKFNQGFATTEYLSASLLDQVWHQLSPEQARVSDVAAFEQRALANAGVDYAPVPPRYRTTYFSHTFSGGYSAGYYSYIWSEVLVADTDNWFKENGGLKRENGDWYRERLLSRGGSVEAMQLYRDFRGRDPIIEPLLERRGLTPAASR
ncbi:peptidyl-dipeptidase Dcp [Hydrocarboniphaga daqingensis]|uniref:Peptidyl-dipeptidase Dcp n=1 Tax=Hydrocarboniphaga daqingensis TaxID=490188 RepID=A0A1M5K084_9GAMM|nr:M3 family metallopeptidase [Hydrocarboniphaga daqingensis]SHG46257.1 peptidyl-dipeptidase Dcp [Hydrocarboniphaga daqingensis]